MAHLLTILWIAFWGTAQLFWLRSFKPGATRRSYWQVAVLVSCLTIILFPVISNDDDAAWARQIQVDFESVGVTQATRAFSRFELPAIILDRAASPVSLPPLISKPTSISSEIAGKPNTPYFRSIPVLRGPPSHV